MDIADLTKKSPIRQLETELGGGLGPGQLGFVVARHGTGKTSFLVGIALDSLLRGRRILHVALDMSVDHAREFYDQIFAGMTTGIESTLELHLSMERSRRIHAYHGATYTLEKLQNAVQFMRDHASFSPDLIIMDGYDLANSSVAEIEGLKELAQSNGAELWITGVRHRDEPVEDADGVPEPAATYKDIAHAIIGLQTVGDHVEVRAFQPGDERVLSLVMDPTTQLLR